MDLRESISIFHQPSISRSEGRLPSNDSHSNEELEFKLRLAGSSKYCCCGGSPVGSTKS